MSFCPLKHNINNQCDHNCAWWVREDYMCAITILALSVKDIRDMCKKQEEEMHDLDKDEALENINDALTKERGFLE